MVGLIGPSSDYPHYEACFFEQTGNSQLAPEYFACELGASDWQPQLLIACLGGIGGASGAKSPSQTQRTLVAL